MRQGGTGIQSPIAVVLIGPPGSGKGTQAGRVASLLGVPAISTGEMLRSECQSHTSLGKTIAAALAAGKLLDDALVNRMVARRLAHSDCRNGFLLDGYPRTVPQARFLDSWLTRWQMEPPLVLHFHIAPEEVVARLAGRRQCQACGRVFNITGKPWEAARCETDGSTLVRRSDDEPAVIRERLKLYAQGIEPLLRYYRAGRYHDLQAEQGPDDVFQQIVKAAAVDTALAAAR